MNNWCICFVYLHVTFFATMAAYWAALQETRQCWSYRDERNQPLIHKVLILAFCQDGGSSSGTISQTLQSGNFPLGFTIHSDFSDDLEGVLQTRFFDQKKGSQDTFPIEAKVENYHCKVL